MVNDLDQATKMIVGSAPSPADLLGFCISEDLADAPESRFSASWGESDCECFPSLEAAQAWCQEEIDRFVESIAFIEIHTKDHEVNN